MGEAKVIKAADVARLIDATLARVGRVAAPIEREGRSVFSWIRSGKDVKVPPVNTSNSIKEFFFPRMSAVLRYRRKGKDVEIEGRAAAAKPFVIFGARPCDAAALDVLDKVFTWDTVDADWRARREAATVITVACDAADDYCFCTSVGLAPDATAGADVTLFPLERGDYSAEAATAKGAVFMKESAGFFASGGRAAKRTARVAKRFEAAAVRASLREAFDSGFWAGASERCLGCGICTYYCPTCHCFDIQDEADAGSGVRAACWDSCSFALFTRHTSGHNPRPDRAARWRQRIMHKFSYYPERFGIVSCTGCGRCGRLCPVDLGVEESACRAAENA